MMLFLVNYFLKDGIQQGMKFLLSEKQNLEWTAYFFIHFFFKKGNVEACEADLVR